MANTDQVADGIIYKGTFICVGQFRRAPNHPNFKGPHFTGHTLMVFPRTSVMIVHEGKAPIIADPNSVMFYNGGQVYSRVRLSERGDICEWFAIADHLVGDAIRPFDDHVDDHPCTPFSFSHGPSDATSYFKQRLIVDHVLDNLKPDHLFIEETVLCVLKQVTGASYSQPGMIPNKIRNLHEREIVNAIQKFLTMHFEQDISLKEIALHLNYSPYHLCRIFQKHIGQSIHQYLKDIRLRTSLEYITQANSDLTLVAMKLGFSSHSHFTEAFRKKFGRPPSGLRNTSRLQVHDLQSKISIA